MNLNFHFKIGFIFFFYWHESDSQILAEEASLKTTFKSKGVSKDPWPKVILAPRKFGSLNSVRQQCSSTRIDATSSLKSCKGSDRSSTIPSELYRKLRLCLACVRPYNVILHP